MQIKPHPKKRSAKRCDCRRQSCADPMVSSRNPPHRYQARAKADQTRLHYRMVILAKSSPGHRATSSHQSKIATVMLGRRGKLCSPVPRSNVKKGGRSSNSRGACRRGIRHRDPPYCCEEFMRCKGRTGCLNAKLSKYFVY